MKKNIPNKERRETKKEMRKEAKEMKEELKKKELNDDASKPKQRNRSFLTAKIEKPQEKELPTIVLSSVRQRPSLIKSNSVSGVDRERLHLRFRSVQDVSQQDEPLSPSGFGSRLRKSPMYLSQMEMPSINEDGQEGSRRNMSFAKRVTNLLRGASNRLRKSSETMSRSISGSLQNLRADEYFGNSAPLTRTTSLLLPSKAYDSTSKLSRKEHFKSDPDSEYYLEHPKYKTSKTSLNQKRSFKYSKMELSEVADEQEYKRGKTRPQSLFCDYTIAEEDYADSVLRSRSLNNLDGLITKSSRYGETTMENSMMFLGQPSNLVRSTSMPDVSSIKFKENLQYVPGPTKGKSAFVRRNNKLRHTFSQGAYDEYLRLRLPPNYDLSKLLSKKLFKPKRGANNITFIYIPAVGNTTLRCAVQQALRCQINMENYFVRLEGMCAPLSLDRTDVRHLAGRTAYLMEKKGHKKGGLFNKNSFQTLKTSGKTKFFSKSTEEGSGRHKSTPTCSDHKPHGLSRKINKLLFGHKTDPLKMERLEAKLKEFEKNGIPMVPYFEPITLSHSSYKTLLYVKDTTIEMVLDITQLSEREANRQRVILEMIATEASYIKHIRTAVEIFYSAAYALQADGIMTDVDSKKIFANITDVLNVNLAYWGTYLYPMFADAVARKERFNTQLLYDGILNFHEKFKPYEIFVYAQKNVQKYRRHIMDNNAIFTAYITWCESQKECNRLKLADILVKPMQRLTKYVLLFDSMYTLTDYEPERTTIEKMLYTVKNYMEIVNLSISYWEDSAITDKVINCIDGYDVLDKDEELEPILREYLNLNLKGPIPGCDPKHRRILILQGDLRMKDNLDPRFSKSNIEIKAFLLTDMLLVCAQSKRKRPEDEVTYKVIRQKYMVDKLKLYPITQMKDGKEELVTLQFVYVDDTGTAVNFFSFSDINGSHKETAFYPSLKTWENAINEAKMTVKLARMYHQQPAKYNMEFDTDSLSDTDIEKKEVAHPEKSRNALIKAAQGRVSTMVHGVSLERENNNGSADPRANRSNSRGGSRGRSRDSSRTSRMSSYQQSCSGSYDTNEYGATSTRRIGSGDTSIDRHTISMSSDEWNPDYFYPESNQKHILRSKSPGQKHQIRQQVIQATPNTLSVQPLHALTLGQSMPDLASIEPNTVLKIPKVVETIPRDPNRQMYLRAGPPAGALGPDTRGTSYPPPCPPRYCLSTCLQLLLTLRRGLAISKNPLIKSKHISRDSSPATTSKYDKSPAKVSSLTPCVIEPAIAEAVNLQTKRKYLMLPSTSQHDSEGGQRSQLHSPDVVKGIFE
ncbi:uncharacterized protein LOC143922815 [Arctopsyche grandis]|uniref:uncharacterized protein LOC143922815 n=1 Tax=Arctopsyche grandis TaxID=121162 RepID=UPI00406D642D